MFYDLLCLDNSLNFSSSELPDDPERSNEGKIVEVGDMNSDSDFLEKPFTKKLKKQLR